MRVLLIALAAIAGAGAPATAQAQAQMSAGASLSAVPAVTVHRGSRHDGRGDFRLGRDWRGGRHWDNRGGTTFVYDRDWQGDSAWRPDSFNDWWHDRPDRSMPRWLSTNQGCQRQWWSGGGWRC